MPSSKDIERTSTPRDRDALGRPFNARPRDGLGRPLARGEPGIPTVPPHPVLSAVDSLALAQQLLVDGRPFHAHEVLEAAWKAAPAAERELWQGLAQLAVGLTHLLRGNRVGAASVLCRARERLRQYRDDAPYEVDVPGLIQWGDELLARLRAHDGQSVEDVSTPRLRR